MKKKPAPKTSKTKIRQTHSLRKSSLIRFSRMERKEALAAIRRYLKKAPDHPAAQQLIELFHISAEELTEIGIPYEIIKVLEKKSPFFK